MCDIVSLRECLLVQKFWIVQHLDSKLSETYKLAIRDWPIAIVLYSYVVVLRVFIKLYRSL